MKTIKKLLCIIILAWALLYIEVLLLKYIYIMYKNITIEEFNNYHMIKEFKTINLIINIIFSYFIIKKIFKYHLISSINKDRYEVPFLFSKSYINYAKREYIRVWKLLFLLFVILFLSVASYLVNLPDWDIGISIIMALLSYFLSPISISYCLQLNNFKTIKKILIILIVFGFWWCTVDWIYVAYNEYNNNMYFRWANMFASTVLYILNGLLLSYKGNLENLLEDIKKIDIVKENKLE